MFRALRYLTLCLALLIIAGGFLSAVESQPEFLTHSWTFEDRTPNDYIGGVNGTLVGEADGELQMVTPLSETKRIERIYPAARLIW
ncbi:hypothetical protein JW935_10290 [candidate division KSB1 bacterium]|nr:hypothetical protein [candidate division KSB1 bacterium]